MADGTPPGVATEPNLVTGEEAVRMISKGGNLPAMGMQHDGACKQPMSKSLRGVPNPSPYANLLGTL